MKCIRVHQIKINKDYYDKRTNRGQRYESTTSEQNLSHADDFRSKVIFHPRCNAQAFVLVKTKRNNNRRKLKKLIKSLQTTSWFILKMQMDNHCCA
jgi:hypothetical protein